MKFKKPLIIGMFFLIMLNAGCAKEQMSLGSERIKKTDVTKNDKELNQDKEDIGDEVQETLGNDNSVNMLKLYYVDNSNDEIRTKNVAIDEIESSYIWDMLKTESILKDECVMLSFDDSRRREGYIEIDVDRNFGAQLRSYGTMEEELFMTCIVNTYLDAYQCKGIRITEEGQALESGHVSYDNYIYKMQ